MTDQSMMVVAGPTHGPGMPPFDWNNTTLKELIRYHRFSRDLFDKKKKTKKRPKIAVKKYLLRNQIKNTPMSSCYSRKKL